MSERVAIERKLSTWRGPWMTPDGWPAGGREPYPPFTTQEHGF